MKRNISVTKLFFYRFKVVAGKYGSVSQRISLQDFTEALEGFSEGRICYGFLFTI